MTFDIAKIRAASGFILSSEGKMFTGTGGEHPTFVEWPSLEPFEPTPEQESADWEEV